MDVEAMEEELEVERENVVGMEIKMSYDGQ